MKPPNQAIYTRIHGHYAVSADLPGYNAQFCTYTTMNNETKDIVNVEVIDKLECQLKSVNMDKLGFVKTMEELKKKGGTVVF